MKIRNLFILLTAITLVACSSNTSKVDSSSIEDVPSSSNETTQVTSESSENESVSSGDDTSTSSATTSSSIEQSSSSSSFSASSSQETIDGTKLTINLFNPSCGSVSKEAINDRLTSYINEIAETTFVTSITNESCQITNDIPNKGEKVLQIGASSTAGSLEFTFANSIKSITMTAQTYHKPYTNYQTGELVPNVDTNSVLEVKGSGASAITSIDLAPTNGQPTEKTVSVNINANKLSLNTLNDKNGRVLIKSITFIY